MAEDEEDGELPSVDHGPLNEGPWEKHTEHLVVWRLTFYLNMA